MKNNNKKTIITNKDEMVIFLFEQAEDRLNNTHNRRLEELFTSNLGKQYQIVMNKINNLQVEALEIQEPKVNKYKDIKIIEKENNNGKKANK